MGGGRSFAREEIRGEFFLSFFSFLMVYPWDEQQSPGCGRTGSSWWKGERGGGHWILLTTASSSQSHPTYSSLPHLESVEISPIV